MKIPTIFIPERSLEEKIHELIKKPKNQTSNIPKLIYNQAKEVAEELGELDIPFAIYNFQDEKTGMIIEYAPHWGRASHLRIDVKDEHSFPIVFEYVQHKKSKKQEVRTYIPGEWQERLKELYEEIKKK